MAAPDAPSRRAASGLRLVKNNARRRSPEAMAGLAKGLAIVEAFGSGRMQLTVADAARAAGLTRASARRCLLTLTALGYLDHDGKLFRPLPRMLRLGLAYLGAAPLPQVAQPILESLRDRLGESISVAILQDDESVFVARAMAARIVSTGVNVGAHLPAYCSATGRVLLGSLSDEALRAYLRRVRLVSHTPKTLTKAAAIRAAVTTARAQGFAISDEELELGMRSMAVPVRNAGGATSAALSLSVSSARIAVDTMVRDFLPALGEAAATLGKGL